MSEKSLAELQGWSFQRRVKGAHEALSGHACMLAQIEGDALTEDVDLAEQRRAAIPDDLSDAAKDFMRQMVSESAARSTDGVTELARVAYEGAINTLEPIFGAGAVEAALDQIRKEFG